MSTNKLREYAAARSLVHIERNRPSETETRAYVLRVSDILCLLRLLHDFIPHGYAIIRTADITNLDRQENDAFWERVMQQEDLADEPEIEEKIDLRSMKRAIMSAHSAFGRLVIECENEEDELQDFYIGSLVRMKKETVFFDHFDTCGRWEKEPSAIELSDITRIEIESPYIKTFWKHLESGAPNASNARPVG